MQLHQFEMDNDDATADEVNDVIETLNRRLQEEGISATYGNITLLNESIAEGISTFQFVFSFTALLIGFVGALGLLFTLSMSVFERQKEIGMMRSIGASSRTIIAQFLAEGISVGVLTWLVGIPLSYAVYWGMLAIIDIGEGPQEIYSVQVLLMGLVGIIAITAVASILPSLVAARKTVSDILRYQ